MASICPPRGLPMSDTRRRIARWLMSEQSATPWGLSARDMAAEAVMVLVVEGLLPKSPATIVRIAEVTRIPVPVLRDAWRRLDRGGYRPPVAIVPSLPDSPAPAPVDLEQQRRSRQRRGWAEANPEPGMRRCARCGEVQPEENFPWKDGRKVVRRSYDSDCWKAKQRERYLSMTKVKLLNQVGLVFKITGADELGSLCCADCGVPFTDGDMVRGEHVTLRHDDCSESVYKARGRA